jgi:hypothetical protein
MTSLSSLARQKADEMRVDVSKIPPYAIAGVKDYEIVCKKLKEAGKEYPGTKPNMWFTEYAMENLTKDYGIGNRLSATAVLLENGNKPLPASQMRKALGGAWSFAPIRHAFSKDGTVSTETFSTEDRYPFLERLEAYRDGSGNALLELNFLGELSVKGLDKLFTSFPPEKNREYYLSNLKDSLKLSLKKDGTPREHKENRVAALRMAIEDITKEWK